jgi:hypothetical protein
MSDEPTRLNGNVASPAAATGAFAEPRDRFLRPRFLLLVAGGVAVVLIAVVVLLQTFVAQRIPELTMERLQKAQELWESVGPAAYDMDVEIRGAQPGLVQIEVRDGEVAAMMRDGRSPPMRTWDVWTVTGMFDTLERELELAEDPEHEMQASAGVQLQLRCEFDPKFGFPRRYHRFATGGAPEVFWQVKRFERR